LVSDLGDRVLAGAVNGSLRLWSVTGAQLLAHVETEARGQFLASVDWSRSLVLLAGECGLEHRVVAYDLAACASVWSFCLQEAPTLALAVDWAKQRCLLAPRGVQLELRALGGDRRPCGDLLASPAKFEAQRLHPRGLIRVDWPSDRALVFVEPYALELWCLQRLEPLQRFRDPGGDGTEVVSLDVNWTAPVPQAAVCRHYIDWELVAGEVCIQQWDVQEGGTARNVCADHPMVGGFDIIDAVAQV